MNHDLWVALLLVAASFATAALSAVAGFGGAVLLLPVFLAVFGPRDAVAVLTVAQLASNGSRVWFNRREIDRQLVKVLTSAPLPALTRVIGVFLLMMVAWRRIRPAATRIGDRGFVAVGAASGFGSALVGSVGPMVAPFFLARGLTRGAYIGTETHRVVRQPGRGKPPRPSSCTSPADRVRCRHSPRLAHRPNRPRARPRSGQRRLGRGRRSSTDSPSPCSLSSSRPASSSPGSCCSSPGG